MQKKQLDNTEYRSVEMKKDFVNAPHWSIEKWISVLAKGGGQKKRFQHCLNPNYLHQFLYLRAIQGHSGSTVNFCIARQCTVTRRFYRVFYHVGNEKASRSIVNHGLLPGGVSLRTGRQAVFFTVVNPMDNQDGLGETCHKQESRHTKKSWKRFQNTVCWCNLKLAQQKGLQFYQTRSNAVILHDTLLAEVMQKAICMKTKDQLSQRESVILRPHVVLKANSQCDLQDLLVQEARSPWETQQDAESYVETRSNTADDRIPGMSISTVKLQDAREQINVATLFETFEKHQHKEQFLKDMSQKQEINRFREESQQLLVDMTKQRSSSFASLS